MCEVDCAALSGLEFAARVSQGGALGCHVLAPSAQERPILIPTLNVEERKSSHNTPRNAAKSTQKITSLVLTNFIRAKVPTTLTRAPQDMKCRPRKLKERCGRRVLWGMVRRTAHRDSQIVRRNTAAPVSCDADTSSNPDAPNWLHERHSPGLAASLSPESS